MINLFKFFLMKKCCSEFYIIIWTIKIKMSLVGTQLQRDINKNFRSMFFICFLNEQVYQQIQWWNLWKCQVKSLNMIHKYMTKWSISPPTLKIIVQTPSLILIFISQPSSPMRKERPNLNTSLLKEITN